ncbi:MAG: hypothetical protein AAF443_04145 [Chlamydiota bacterium]
MKKFLIIPLIFLSIIWADTPSQLAESTLRAPQNFTAMKQPQLTINNRTLAKINGKVISLIDVIKRMDLDLFHYDPNYNPSPIEKYQYYLSRWQIKLDNMIADELILLDVERKKEEKREIEISDGKVREELENRFGPNVMGNLEKVHLSYDEAFTLLKSELTIRELTGLNAQARAVQKATPALIYEAYQKYLADNPPEDIYNYQFLSIRSPDPALSEEIAARAAQFLEQSPETLQEVADHLSTLENKATITISDVPPTQGSDLSDQHRSVLESLNLKAFSTPIPQTSRRSKTPVFRIFHLKEHTQNQPQSFAEMQYPLKVQLMEEEYDKQMQIYIKALKSKFSYDRHDPKYPLPENYQPFVLS